MAERMPTFIVVGAAKCGTTALHHYLDEHPQIYMPQVLKETNFFAYEGEDSKLISESEGENLFRVKTIEEYQALFAGATNEMALGEVSPRYLESTVAAARMRQQIPEVKILVSLRDPSDRAFSGLLMQVRNSRQAFREDAPINLESHCVWVGLYHEKLKRYYEQFPRSQIRVMMFDDLRRDTPAFMSDVYRFVGVDAALAPSTERRHNVGGLPKRPWLNAILRRLSRSDTLKRTVPRSLIEVGQGLRARNIGPKPKLSAEERARLVDYYREDILRVQDLIDRDLSGWLET